MRTISILGSTGSIGTQTLELVRENKDIYPVALAAGSNIALLEEQAREFNPKVVAVWEEDKANILRTKLSDTDIKVVCNMDGLIEVATRKEAELVVTAIVGMIGIVPTIEAIKAKKDIALANKETLVTAGHIIMPLAKEYHVSILPVDSEHSAIFQSLQGNEANPIKRIFLTASGGPFLNTPKEELKHVTVEDALRHPNWSMGKKITIDSATMVNKGLEVMEAKWLFDVDLDKIQVLIHPESIIHSAVEYYDHGIMAQLGRPDMKLPIAYALYYPKRVAFSGEDLDFFALKNMTFYAPDVEKFPGLKLAFHAMKQGGNMPTVFNAANEKAVSLFLNRKIDFLTIPELIDGSMEAVSYMENPNLQEILTTEKETYEWIESRVL